MADQGKKKGPQARLPRGLVDRGPADIAATRDMLDVIRKVYELYGFEPVETPAIEYTDALGKFLPDQDRPNEGVFSFQDDDEQWLSLRYDLTAPLARYVAENFERIAKPYRSYRVGYVFRNEKPGPGRFRQFMQFDADTVGSGSPAADAEICMMAADTMEALGIQRGDYVVKVNNRKILDGVLEAIGLGGEDKAGQRLTVLRALDKMDKFPWAEVAKLLGTGRKDESGDFTKGAGLSERQTDDLRRFVEHAATCAATYYPDAFRLLAEKGDPASAYAQVLDGLSFLGANDRLTAGMTEIEAMHRLFAAAHYDHDRIRIDPSVVRGLEYYTGPVYEVELTFPVTNEDGQVVRFGSVAGGGRYDGLVARFRGEEVPATGFSIGVSRLAAALKAIGRLNETPVRGPVVVLVMDRDQLGYYQQMVTDLRKANIRAELYLGSAGMKAQMKYADRRNSPAVIIAGSDERERGVVQIKDLDAGAEAAKSITDNAEWRAARPAQMEVPRDKLVETIQSFVPAYQ